MRFLPIIGILLALNLLFSCSNEKSLQQFIITQQEKQDIISFDLPTSLIATTENFGSEEDLKTLKSLKKVNILAYQIKDTLNNRYAEEKKHINTILKQNKYSELMRYGKGSQGAKFYLVGDEESVDELIIFANDKELGWLLVRILGKKMQPEKIMQLIQNTDFSNSNYDLSQLKDILAKSHIEVGG